MEFTHVDGKNKGKVLLYAISTCIWCKKTKHLLTDLGIAYDYIDVDLLSEKEKSEIRKEVLKWKDRVAYPLIVINGEQCIPAYEPEKIKETLGK
ncbi:MAG: glutaredoxin family protein [Spirochaetales bacterium]|nr:glutaredoxin family protein [Spirochaetales bacterium]